MGDVLTQFFVAGRARTKGHMKPQPKRSGRGTLKISVHDRPLLKAWLVDLIKGIREQTGIEVIKNGRQVIGCKPPWPYEGPVTVDAMFYFRRERSADSTVWPSHDTPYPTAEDIGDEDTLRRAVNDALKMAFVIADDRWVIGPSDTPGALNGKRWIDHPSAQPGVLCVVRHA